MALRHRTPIAPGYRCWAAAVIVLQCERGGRPVTAVYGFCALLYSAFGAQDLSDEHSRYNLQVNRAIRKKQKTDKKKARKGGLI